MRRELIGRLFKAKVASSARPINFTVPLITGLYTVWGGQSNPEFLSLKAYKHLIKEDRLEEDTVLKKEKSAHTYVLKKAYLERKTPKHPMKQELNPYILKERESLPGGWQPSDKFILQLTACHTYERSETTQFVCRGNQRKNFHCLNRAGYWVHRHVKVAQIFIK